ncbi:MAG: adenosylmethionine decarboxylase [Mariprofundaceae bacterium]|nr:adenosylmethionine decarboxylase [Mariprofundaceae bacterium]
MTDLTCRPSVHLLLDFFGATQLTEQTSIERAMRVAAKACHATVIDVRLHSFGEGLGVTGVALLAESHISIHTWPESGYAALDVFMCGDCDPHLAIAPLQAAFNPKRTNIREVLRGTVE